jgi:hypothetical protein
MIYYSAKLLFIILVDDGNARRKNHYGESILVFKARDFDHAFTRALELGRAQERTYKNVKGKDVRWALVEVIDLDCVGRRLDGVEVSSKLHARISKKPIFHRHRFHPERSRPGQSI